MLVVQAVLHFCLNKTKIIWRTKPHQSNYSYRKCRKKPHYGGECRIKSVIAQAIDFSLHMFVHNFVRPTVRQMCSPKYKTQTKPEKKHMALGGKLWPYKTETILATYYYYNVLYMQWRYNTSTYI